MKAEEAGSGKFQLLKRKMTKLLFYQAAKSEVLQINKRRDFYAQNADNRSNRILSDHLAYFRLALHVKGIRSTTNATTTILIWCS